MTKGKVFDSPAEAIKDIPDGATIMIGGWTVLGDHPSNLTRALRDHGVRNLTIIASSPGTSGRQTLAVFGVEYSYNNILIENKQVDKFICSVGFVNTSFDKARLAGELEVEFAPQGTLAERIRTGGFGFGGFYTRVGVGTVVEEGKEKRIIDGKEYILELPLRADYALIRAYKADTLGNLVYRGAMKSFNVIMAPAANVTIAEVDEIVEPGELDPEVIVTPHIFVHRIVRRGRDETTIGY